MQEHKNKVEAVLFTTGRFITIEELASLCELGSPGYVKQLLEELKKDYQSRETALELIEQDNKFKLNIKNTYGYLANKVIKDTEFESPAIKTLAYIAYKQPVEQSKIIKIRGNKAYDHIKQLLEQNLITSDKKGRTRLLKLAKNFYDYFDVNKDALNIKFTEIKEPESQEPIQNHDQPKKQEGS